MTKPKCRLFNLLIPIIDIHRINVKIGKLNS